MNFIRLRFGNRMHQHKDRIGKLTHPQGFTWEISQTRWNWRVQIDVSLNTSLWCMRTNFKSEIWKDGNIQHAHRKRHHEIQKQKNILATFRNGDLLNSGNVYIKEHQIVNIEGTSTVPWSTVQSAHTLHQRRLLPPSEKVEMLQVSIGLQVTHIAILMVHCGRRSGPLEKQIPQAISPPVLGTLTTTLSTCNIGV